MIRLITHRKRNISLTGCLPNLFFRLICFLLLTRDNVRNNPLDNSDIWKSIQGAYPEADYTVQDPLLQIQTMGTFLIRHEGLVLSGKNRNKQQKIINGNGLGNKVSLIHWNMGSKYWSRKIHEIEAVTQQLLPDVFAIYEANLLHSLTDLEKHVPGYQLFLPPIPANQKLARLALLLREGVIAELQEHLMHPAIAAVWLKIGARGGKAYLIGMKFFSANLRDIRLENLHVTGSKTI